MLNTVNTVAVSDDDLALTTPAEFAQGLSNAITSQLGESNPEVQSVQVLISEKVDIDMDAGSAEVDQDFYDSVENAACAGMVGTCSVGTPSSPSAPVNGRSLHNARRLAAITLPVAREYDYTQSTNGSTPVGDLIEMQVTGIDVTGSTTTSLSATSIITSLGDASTSSVASQLDSSSLTAALAKELPAISIHVSEPLIIVPPAAPPLTPPLSPPPPPYPFTPPPEQPPSGSDRTLLIILVSVFVPIGTLVLLTLIGALTMYYKRVTHPEMTKVTPITSFGCNGRLDFPGTPPGAPASQLGMPPADDVSKVVSSTKLAISTAAGGTAAQATIGAGALIRSASSASEFETVIASSRDDQVLKRSLIEEESRPPSQEAWTPRDDAGRNTPAQEAAAALAAPATAPAAAAAAGAFAQLPAEHAIKLRRVEARVQEARQGLEAARTKAKAAREAAEAAAATE